MYMQDQQDICEKFRSVLFDWLIDVHHKFQLRDETLYLCQHLTDGYLSKKNIERSQLQLVGITSLFIASKFEEIYPPSLKNFVKITDNAYDSNDVIKMEGQILNAFNFDLFYSSPLMYLKKYCKKVNMDEKNFHLGWYLIELSIIDYKSIQFDNHLMACAAIYLVNKIRLKQNWTINLEKMTGCSDNQVRPCAKYLCALIQNSQNITQQAVQRKFSTQEHFQVSKLRLERNN